MIQRRFVRNFLTTSADKNTNILYQFQLPTFLLLLDANCNRLVLPKS